MYFSSNVNNGTKNEDFVPTDFAASFKPYVATLGSK